MNRPERFLTSLVTLLPPDRRDWGRAMLAELAAIPSLPRQWSFARGCAVAVLRLPAVLRRLSYFPVTAVLLVSTVVGTATVAYPPLRWALVAEVVVLLAVAWLGRSGAFGPVGGDPAARLVRTGGYLIVGVSAFGGLTFMAAAGNPAEKAGNGVPILTVVLAGYLLGFLGLTADGSAVPRRVLVASAGAGGAAAAIWAALSLLSAPVPASIGSAVILIVPAAVIAAAAQNGDRHRVLAALGTGTVGAILTVVTVGLIARYGPPSLIPDLAPAALTPADGLAQSRHEIEDPYVGFLFLGCLAATGLGAVSVRGRRAEAVYGHPRGAPPL